MNLLLDTQVLVWLLSGDRRLRKAWLKALADPLNRVFVSAVVAWEYADLKSRGRLPVDEDIADLADLYGFELLDFPAVAWAVAADLPDFHRDPVDRMVIAHAVLLDMVLVTADRTMRRYPVQSLW